MAFHKLQDVYMPVGVPHITFVKRENLELSIVTWKYNKSKHLLIFGPSKSGKTTLWKQYVPAKDVIKIACNSTTTIENIYSSILFELESFYTSEINETTTSKIGIGAEIKTLLGIGSFKVGSKIESTNDNSNKMNPIAVPQLEANLLVKYLKPSGKIIVIEDFHYVQEELKEKISQDLKAFSDEMCPWIIVGVVQHKTSKLLSYNVDLQQRISELSVERFSQEQLARIIELGENALNIRFSDGIKERILSESYGSASMVQNICQRICILNGITETCSDIVKIEDHELFTGACKLFAEEAKIFYGDIVRKVSVGGRSDGRTEKYKWFLKMIRDKDIPEHGLKNTEVFGYLKDLGHPDIQQSSVTEGLLYLPRLLQKNNLPSIFDYDGMYFYLLDNYMKFVFKWAPELIDDLFESDGNDDISEKIKELNSIIDIYLYNEFVSLLSQMKVTYEDKKTKIAEIQHPVFGKKNITENDIELIKIIEQLKLRDFDVSMDNDTLLGFDFGTIIFYLGFLFAKEHIACHPISMRSVTVSLTDQAKNKLKP
jgi:hypothetical protein